MSKAASTPAAAANSNGTVGGFRFLDVGRELDAFG